jgi:hypothetical protein
MTSEQRPCTRCQSAPRAPSQRWCLGCKREAERQRRAQLRALGQVKPADLARVLIQATSEPDRSALAAYLSRFPGPLDGVRHVVRFGLQGLRQAGSLR